MPQSIMDWLNQSQPPTGYGMIPTHDIRDAEQTGTVPYSPPMEDDEEFPPPAREQPQPAPIANEPIGKVPTGVPDDAEPRWELMPVYAVPPELGGGEYIGPLEYAPSLPQDLKPVRYVRVPA